MNQHDHSHEHSHPHDRAHETSSASHHLAGPGPTRHTAGQGPTVLDIGDDVGALVLYTSAALVGAEIEISPDGAPNRRRHVAVHAREFPGGTAYAAVYYGLTKGSYELWAADGSVALTVSIDGDAVTESVWPAGILAPR